MQTWKIHGEELHQIDRKRKHQQSFPSTTQRSPENIDARTREWSINRESGLTGGRGRGRGREGGIGVRKVRVMWEREKERYGRRGKETLEESQF